MLVAVEQNDKIDGLLIILNTVGGDVEAGLAIAELMAGMKKPVVSLVLGGGHSIGVPIAVAANHPPIIRPLYLGGATLLTKLIPMGLRSSSATVSVKYVPISQLGLSTLCAESPRSLGEIRSVEAAVITAKPTPAKSIPKPIFTGAEGSLPLLAR